MRLYATRNVRHQVVDGLVVLLDLRDGNYVMLGREASALGQAAIGGAERVPPGFASACVQRGYLQSRPDVNPARARRLPVRTAAAPLTAWWSLLATNRDLSRHGFATTYRTYGEFAKPAASGDLEPAIARAEVAFLRAENAFPAPNAPRDCLPRSLALYRWLLTLGLPADHVIGVRNHPFAAHAWVALGERIVCDSPDYIGAYAPLARI